MKKILSAAIVATLVALSATPVSACGSHNRSRNVRTVNYSVCAIQGCTLTGLHTHSNVSYTAHYYGDGHDYHDYCGIQDCAIIGYHEHEGAYCFGHAINDGHDYHEYCGVQNCIIDGYHEHGGAYCFGHTANDGHGYHNYHGRYFVR